MAAWYLAPSLAVLRDEVDTRWPWRDRASDGTIGDEAHQGTNSDHNPNSRDSVDAWDMDKDGVAVGEVIAAFQRHPSSNYWIWNREIADKDDGWRRRPYNGDNPHTQHVHFSIRQTATAEQDTRSWGLVDNMPLTTEQAVQLKATDARMAGVSDMKDSIPTSWVTPPGTESIKLTAFLKAMDGKIMALSNELAAIRQTLEDLVAAGGNVDTAAILAGVRDIVATGLESGATGVREEA